MLENRMLLNAAVITTNYDGIQLNAQFSCGRPPIIWLPVLLSGERRAMHRGMRGSGLTRWASRATRRSMLAAPYTAMTRAAPQVVCDCPAHVIDRTATFRCDCACAQH
jgi:hypothetical protein